MRARWVTTTQARTPPAASDRAGADVLAEDQGRPGQREQRLEQLDLADLGDAARAPGPAYQAKKPRNIETTVT